MQFQKAMASCSVLDFGTIARFTLTSQLCKSSHGSQRNFVVILSGNSDSTFISFSRYLPGSVTLYGMNLRSVGVNVTFPQLDGQLKIYLLTAPNQDLKSRYVYL